MRLTVNLQTLIHNAEQISMMLDKAGEFKLYLVTKALPVEVVRELACGFPLADNRSILSDCISLHLDPPGFHNPHIEFKPPRLCMVSHERHVDDLYETSTPIMMVDVNDRREGPSSLDEIRGLADYLKAKKHYPWLGVNLGSTYCSPNFQHLNAKPPTTEVIVRTIEMAHQLDMMGVSFGGSSFLDRAIPELGKLHYGSMPVHFRIGETWLFGHYLWDTSRRHDNLKTDAFHLDLKVMESRLKKSDDLAIGPFNQDQDYLTVLHGGVMRPHSNGLEPVVVIEDGYPKHYPSLQILYSSVDHTVVSGVNELQPGAVVRFRIRSYNTLLSIRDRSMDIDYV